MTSFVLWPFRRAHRPREETRTRPDAETAAEAKSAEREATEPGGENSAAPAPEVVPPPPPPESSAGGKSEADAAGAAPAARADETTGGYLDLGQVQCWYASHVGPRHADKAENQDAAFAAGRDGMLFFALADGVSTSFGSRFAAAAIAGSFCRHLAAASTGRAGTDAAILAAVEATRAELDDMLHRLLSRPESEEWKAVRGASTLGMDVILRLAENTVDNKKKFWGPVMAATLIGGALWREGGAYEARMIRVGDGVAEHVDAAGNIASVYTMDAEQTAIAAALGPGAALRDAAGQGEVKRLTLRPGEMLLVSSDGLMRQGGGSVMQGLRRVCPAELAGLTRRRGAAALEILRVAVAYADECFRRDAGQRPFADNLSIIAICIEQSRS